MIEIQQFSRLNRWWLGKDYALCIAFSGRPAQVAHAEDPEADVAAFGQALLPWRKKHRWRCRDVIFVFNGGEDMVPYAEAFFRRLFAEALIVGALGRIRCRLECPKLSSSAGLELIRRFNERKF